MKKKGGNNEKKKMNEDIGRIKKEYEQGKRNQVEEKGIV